MSDPDLPLTYVHTSPSATPTTGAIFILHGRGADEQDLIPVAEYLPDTYHIISFRAPTALGPGYTWYDLDTSDGLHNSQPDPEDFDRATTLVTDSIDAAITSFDIDTDHHGLLGFSQGAIMAFALLLDNPEQFAWVAGLHGYLPDQYADHSPDTPTTTPVFIAAGDTDQVIPATRAIDAADRLQSLGFPVTVDTYATGHGIGQDELEDLIEFVSANTP